MDKIDSIFIPFFVVKKMARVHDFIQNLKGDNSFAELLNDMRDFILKIYISSDNYDEVQEYIDQYPYTNKNKLSPEAVHKLAFLHTILYPELIIGYTLNEFIVNFASYVVYALNQADEQDYKYFLNTDFLE